MIFTIFCFAASAQWRPLQPYFMRYYGLRADSAIQIPRDTIGPAADSALLGYKSRQLWYKTDTGWVQVVSSRYTDSIYFDGYQQSYNKYHAAEGILISLNGDTVINIFRLDSAFTHAGGKGQIVKRLSYDNGLSWTVPEVIYDSQYDDRNISAGKTISGRIVVIFRRYNGTTVSGNNIDQGRIYSDDGGITWSAYSTISSLLTNPAPFGNIVMGGDGAYYSNFYVLGRSRLIRSIDGDSWTETTDIFNFTDTRIPSETVLASAGGNNLIALSRDDSSPDSSYFQHVSIDNGVTWSYSGRTNMNSGLRYVNNEPPAILYDTARQLLIAISTSRNHTVNAPYTVKEDSMFVYLNHPSDVLSNPTGWSKKIVIGRPAPSTPTLYGYPNLCRVGSGNYLGIVTELGFTGYSASDRWGEEFAALFQFDLNVDQSVLPGASRYSNTVAAMNPITGRFDYRTDRVLFGDGADSISFFRRNSTMKLGGMAADPNREVLSIVNGSGSPIFRANTNGQVNIGFPSPASLGANTNIRGEVRFFSSSTGLETIRLTGTGRIGIGNDPAYPLHVTGVAALGNTSRVIGTGIGAANTAMLYFTQSDGTTRMGYFGDGSGSTSDINIVADLGELTLSAANGIRASRVLHKPIIAPSGNLTLDATHSTVRVTNSTHVITLPAASTCVGRVYTLINYNTGGNVTISSVNRDGSATTSLPNNAKWVVQSDGTNWYVIQD